jgi:Bacterial PH domain
MIYRSKVDHMAPTVLITLTISFIAIGLVGLIGTGSAVGWFVLILCPPILPLIVMLVAWPMTYDTGATRSNGEPILWVRGGRLLRYEIPIAGIKEVRPTNSVASSMSWSYDRIEVISRSPTFPHRPARRYRRQLYRKCYGLTSVRSALLRLSVLTNPSKRAGRRRFEDR